MKLKKISLSEMANAELNEKEMSRILGGGNPGCCQCGCHYATAGGSSTSANDSANDSGGQTSDPGAQTCDCKCSPSQATDCVWCPPTQNVCYCPRQDRLCK